MIAVYAVEGEALLRAVFGDDLTGATGALPWLGGAMTLLACSYLCVQYLLALGRAEFVPVLALAAVADVVVLARIGRRPDRAWPPPWPRSRPRAPSRWSCCACAPGRREAPRTSSCPL